MHPHPNQVPSGAKGACITLGLDLPLKPTLRDLGSVWDCGRSLKKCLNRTCSHAPLISKVTSDKTKWSNLNHKVLQNVINSRRLKKFSHHEALFSKRGGANCR